MCRLLLVVIRTLALVVECIERVLPLLDEVAHVIGFNWFNQLCLVDYTY